MNKLERNISLLERNKVLQLIQLYKENPLLWDITHKDNKNIMLRDQAWSEIAEQLRLSVAQCKHRIRMIRIQLRYKERMYSRTKQEIKRKWYPYEHLDFLKKFEIDHAEDLKHEKCDTVNNSNSNENENDDTANVLLTPEQTLELIELYRQNPILWDPFDENHKSIMLRRKALRAIAQHMGIPVKSCKEKLRSARIIFRREYKKCLEDRTYQSNWYAYDSFDFLKRTIQTTTACSQIIRREMFNTNENTILNDNFDFADPDNIEDISDVPNIDIKRAKMKTNNELTAEYCNINSTENNYTSERDEFMVYGETVAHQLRKIKDPKKVCILKHKIDVLLYEAELESYADTE